MLTIQHGTPSAQKSTTSTTRSETLKKCLHFLSQVHDCYYNGTDQKIYLSCYSSVCGVPIGKTDNDSQMWPSIGTCNKQQRGASSFVRSQWMHKLKCHLEIEAINKPSKQIDAETKSRPYHIRDISIRLTESFEFTHFKEGNSFWFVEW